MDEPVYVEPAALPPVLDEDKKELMRDFWAGVERRPDAVHVYVFSLWYFIFAN